MIYLLTKVMRRLESILGVPRALGHWDFASIDRMHIMLEDHEKQGAPFS